MSVRRLAVILTCLVSLTGCSPTDLVRDDPDPYKVTQEFLIGSWQCREMDSTVVFADALAFTATNIGHMFALRPDSLPAGTSPSDDFGGVGTFQLHKPGDGHTDNHVQLVFSHVGPLTPLKAKYGSDLSAFSRDKEIWLRSDSCHYVKQK
jgi:hypothetical protein